MMADRRKPIETASRKRGSDENKMRHFPHLKPLSVYSRMVFSEATDSCSVSPSGSPDGPSWNLKVELSNGRASVGRKRRLDDSCLDETCDTPPKKPCLAKRSSPDSACDLGSFGTFRQVTLVSAQSSSVVLEEIKRVEKTLSDQTSLGWIDGTDKSDGYSSASLTDVHSSSPVIVCNQDSTNVIAFDYDVDQIMCLSPIDSADGLEGFIHSCRTYYEEHFSAEEGHSSWGNSRRKRRTSECSLGKDATGSDEGYVTKSYYTADPGESKVTTENEITKRDEACFIKSSKITVPNLSNEKTPPVSNPIMSTPLDKFRALAKPSPILSPKLDLYKESWSSPSLISKPVKTPTAFSPSSCANLDAGNTEALTTIPFLNVNKSKKGNTVREGMPIHKSVVCHNKEKKNAKQVKEDVVSVSQRQFREETDASDSFKNTLPLQVQV